MKQNDFVFFMRSVICNFENNNNHGTAHIYKNSLNSFITFCHSSTIPFRKITPELLKGFEAYLNKNKEVGIQCLHTYVHCVPPTTVLSINIWLPTFHACSSRFIQEHGQTEKSIEYQVYLGLPSLGWINHHTAFPVRMVYSFLCLCCAAYLL